MHKCKICSSKAYHFGYRLNNNYIVTYLFTFRFLLWRCHEIKVKSTSESTRLIRTLTKRVFVCVLVYFVCFFAQLLLVGLQFAHCLLIMETKHTRAVYNLWLLCIVALDRKAISKTLGSSQAMRHTLITL